VAAREARRGVLRAWGCCVPLLLLCGAYVLRCVCEGLLFDRAASLQALHPNCNGVRGGSRDGHGAPHTTHDDAPFRGSSHTSSACLCVVAVTRTTRWPSASGCSRHTQIPSVFSKFLYSPNSYVPHPKTLKQIAGFEAPQCSYTSLCSIRYV
jgi:hypothetical protein